MAQWEESTRVDAQREIDWYNRLFLLAEGEKNMSAGADEHRFSIPGISWGLFCRFALATQEHTHQSSPRRAKPSGERESPDPASALRCKNPLCFVAVVFFFLGLPLCCLNVYMEQLREGGGKGGEVVEDRCTVQEY